jgi:hypothetical protein
MEKTMKVKVEGNATKTLINKAVRMLKTGQKAYEADSGYTHIMVYETGGKNGRASRPQRGCGSEKTAITT